MTTNIALVSRHWCKNLARELFDVVSLLKYLSTILSQDDFLKALVLLRVDEEEYKVLLNDLRVECIVRYAHNFAPYEENGQAWTKDRMIQTFSWVNRFRGDIWCLVAEILDLARLIGASELDLQKAEHRSGRFNGMRVDDWRALLNSNATTFSQWGSHWDVSLMEKHVHGQSTDGVELD